MPTLTQKELILCTNKGEGVNTDVDMKDVNPRRWHAQMREGGVNIDTHAKDIDPSCVGMHKRGGV